VAEKLEASRVVLSSIELISYIFCVRLRLVLLVLLKLNLSYDRLTVCMSIFMVDSHLEPTTRFSFLSDNCGFLDVGSPVIYSFY
jgi:hypothetical protein